MLTYILIGLGGIVIGGLIVMLIINWLIFKPIDDMIKKSPWRWRGW